MTEENQLFFFFVAWKLSETNVGTEKGQLGFCYGRKIIMEAGVYFKKELQSNISL